MIQPAPVPAAASDPAPAGRTVLLLRRINTGVALSAGALLMLTVAVTLYDVVARRLGGSLGGTDEISGYAMAIATAWGLSYALTELVHVRIDLIRARLTAGPRALMDLLSILTIAGVAMLVAVQGWGVLAKTFAHDARANTPLETPLWIPQILWWTGWLWFALSASILSLVALVALARRDPEAVAAAAGIDEGAETAELPLHGEDDHRDDSGADRGTGQ